jgi:putative Ca2+/H+ antiporter (TMEM165/GDT1 family)
MTIYILLTAFWVVFLTELIGDKSIYSISSLALRFRPLTVFFGLSAAFMLKMLVAVLVGQALADLPAAAMAALSALTFFATALVLWIKRPDAAARADESKTFFGSVAFSFASVFFIEWGDVGQLTAAALAAHYQAPVAVWVGASLALMTKGVLAITLGIGLRRHLPQNFLRYAAVSLCIIMGLLSVVRIIEL